MDLPKVENCVFDWESRERLLALQNASDEEEYRTKIDEISDWCLEQGLPVAQYRSFDDKNKLLHILKENEICYRVQSEIIHFRNGLNKVGKLLDAVRLAPTECSKLFVASKTPLTFRELKKIYQINWSPEGSNLKTEEKQALYCLEAFLADCEGGSTGISLEEVLGFWTGATAIPPLGFEKLLEVSFVATKQLPEVSFVATKQLPAAHTCGMILSIWRGFRDPDEFEENFKKSIQWAGGFHLV